MAVSKGTGWKKIKQELIGKEKNELLAIIHDLYSLNKDNKLFLETRTFSLEERIEKLESYRKIIIDEFFPDKGFGKLRLSLVKKTITSYEKASSDICGTVDLMLTYIEQVIKFLYDYGDIDEKFFYSIDTVFENLRSRVAVEPQIVDELRILERLDVLQLKSEKCGYGVDGMIDNYIDLVEAISQKNHRPD